MKDPFVEQFVKKPIRRMPWMNRGYFARVYCIQRLIDNFLHSSKLKDTPTQVVNIGAGYDTSFFVRKQSEQALPTRWFEVDFPDVLEHKQSVIEKNPSMYSLISETDDYVMCPCDLRDPTTCEQLLRSAGFRSDIPTLWISECVLIYLKEDALISLVAMMLSMSQGPAFAICYQPFCDQSNFGRTMKENLERRGAPLYSLSLFPSIAAVEEWWKSQKWHTCTAHSMLHLYQQWMIADERTRIQRLEFMDEVEEWELIMNHYQISAASIRAEEWGDLWQGPPSPLPWTD